MISTENQRHYPKGNPLFREGEKGDWAAIIDRGTVAITVERDGKPVLIATRGPDSLIGEMAVIDEGPRSATVTATEDVSVTVLTRADLLARLEAADPIVRLFSQIVLQRLRETMARLKVENPLAHISTRDRVENADIAGAARDKIRLAAQLKDALTREEISLHYQPVVDLARGHLVGFEALMRWSLREGGTIPPGIFIPLAEESDLVCDLTQFALGEACNALRQLNAIRPKDVPPWFVSVNLSARDLARPDFINGLLRTVREKSIEPRLLKLEITESAMMNNPERARATLELAKAEGFPVALDDFGTGYSSLSYLHAFPINLLKIDRSFVQHFLTEDKSLALVESIIRLAKGLGMLTLAEGIEMEEEARLLQSLGCDLAQGYFYAKPLPLSETKRQAEAWRAMALTEE